MLSHAGRQTRGKDEGEDGEREGDKKREGGGGVLCALSSGGTHVYRVGKGTRDARALGGKDRKNARALGGEGQDERTWSGGGGEGGQKGCTSSGRGRAGGTHLQRASKGRRDVRVREAEVEDAAIMACRGLHDLMADAAHLRRQQRQIAYHPDLNSVLLHQVLVLSHPPPHPFSSCLLSFSLRASLLLLARCLMV